MAQYVLLGKSFVCPFYKKHLVLTGKYHLLNGKPIGAGIEFIQINFDGTKWGVTMECVAKVMKEIGTYSKDGEKLS